MCRDEGLDDGRDDGRLYAAALGYGPSTGDVVTHDVDGLRGSPQGYLAGAIQYQYILSAYTLLLCNTSHQTKPLPLCSANASSIPSGIIHVVVQRIASNQMVSTWLIPATRPTEPEMSTHTKQRIVPAVWCGGDAPQEDQFKYADRRYQQKEIKEEEDDDEDESRPPTHPLPTVCERTGNGMSASFAFESAAFSMLDGSN